MPERRSAEPVSGDVRTRLMLAAQRLLAHSVDGQISTREICAAAGVTAPTLYHHFTDKHALLDAVVLEGFTTYLQERRAIPRSGDALQDFRTEWDMHVSFGCEHPAHYRLMFGNPQACQIAPAALVAQEELTRTVADWGAEGRLKVSVESALNTMSAAAVGVTLQLIAAQSDHTHPVATSTRDTIARALFDHPDEPSAGGVARTARQLLDALPHDPTPSLRPTEFALLREWLELLTSNKNDQRNRNAHA